MDDILGKGLGFWTVAQYLTNLAVVLTPLSLPLALLLTGIMTFGSLGEYFELAAIKSAGVPLTRFMRPLFYFAVLVGLVSFLINNYIMPVMNLKTYSLLYDMRKKKPALNIQEGVFSKMFDGYTIRIGSKSENGKDFSDVIIYDHTGKMGNRSVTKAKKGTMFTSPDGQYLVFELYDGWRYDEGEDRQELEQTRMHFDRWNKVFDLSKFEFKRTEEELFKHNEKMLNAVQLYTMMDSLDRRRLEMYALSRRQLKKYLSIFDTTMTITVQPNPSLQYDHSFVELIPDSLKYLYLTHLDGHIRASKSYLFNSVNEVTFNEKRKNKLSIEFNDKFAMAFACIVLFLIGAPLGGIIRKGGIGMPVVVGILFFVVFFIVSSTGRKLAEEQKLPAWFGVWMATIFLTPLAGWVIYKASNDSPLMSKETYVRLWDRIKGIFVRKKSISEG